MGATAELPSLAQLAETTVRESSDVATVYRVWRILAPIDPGQLTEVLFVGRRSGKGTRAGLLTAWLEDDGTGGFRPEITVTDGW